MKVLYYPGCTLKTRAKALEQSAIELARELGIELVEMKEWTCCGTSFNLTTDNFMHQLGPIRNLLRAQKQGESLLTTLCSICYATLFRANEKFKLDPSFAYRVNFFMDEEDDYNGGVRVIHFLSLLKDKVGFDNIRERVRFSLEGLKVGAYYGCQLLRPTELAVDDHEHPSILEEFISALGGVPVDFAEKIECCGNYETIAEPELVANRTYSILESAKRAGASILVTSCPLCHFNIDKSQILLKDTLENFKPIPIVYFTELGLYAITGRYSSYSFVENLIDPRLVLK